ncbi:Ig-like domain-containing protein [Sphingobacterium sp.]|uniref:Ig-like domain-containing protein n=1 Tax=Sphingobacterium sp. TaxID=341027 RepID=UPI0028A804A8|nr:Ig-like domain-containing protein [Sphingobacterium sp.]
MQYKYFITGRSGTRQVFPSNDGTLEKTYEKKSNRSDFSQKLKGTIVLLGEDFKWIYNQELLIYRFDPLVIKIHKYCDGGWNENWFEGIISLNSGEWDIDHCRVELSIENYDKYECFDLGGQTEISLLNGIYPKVDVNPVEANIENEYFQKFVGPNEDWDYFPGEPNPQSKGWAIVEYSFQSFSFNEGHGYSGEYSIKWAREVKFGDSSLIEQGWIEIGSGRFARSPILYDYKAFPYDSNNPNSWGYSYKLLSSPIDNGMMLKSVFELFIQTICPNLSLQSDFFQWNPTSVNSNNYVTGKLNKLTNLVLFQKSDVKRPFNTSNAGSTSGQSSLIKFSDFLEDICNIFQLEWEVTDDNKFKVEHVSYKSRNQGLDTTFGENSNLNKANRKYNYDNDGIPKREVFRFMDDNSSGDFKASPILYTNPIAGKDKEEETYAIKNITTDVMLCLTNSSWDSKIVSDDGFVLVACTPSFGIYREQSIKGGNSINNPLAWAQLHRDFWRHNRFMLNFKMNDANTLALSVKPTKVQEKVKYRMCCGSDFDTEGLIKTQIGDNGILESASFNLFKEIIEMKISFPAEGKLEDNLPPEAINDEAETYKNQPVTVDVLANDIDHDGVIIPSTLNINSVYPGSATITEDYKIRYKPDLDFLGEARIWYTVKDNFGETSNQAIVTILVKDGTSVPVANGNSFKIAKNFELKAPAGSVQKNDTAATQIIVVAETKATDQGGTVVINTNGSFSYVPAHDFVGIDTFPYKIRDTFNNEASGTITIEVFESTQIYVSLMIDDDRKMISEQCGSGGFSNVGDETVSEITINLWSDNLGTVPLDATGYNLVVKLKQKFNDYKYNTSNEYIIPVTITSGVSYQYAQEFTTQREYYGCNFNGIQENYEYQFNIEADLKYTII